MIYYTVGQICTTVLYKLGILADGEPGNENTMRPVRDELNTMLSNWSINYRNYQVYDETCTVTSGSITLGQNPIGTISGDIAEIPATITQVTYIENGYSKPLYLASYSEYTRVKCKETYGEPVTAYIKDGFPFQQIYFYPKPNAGTQIQVVGKPYFKEYNRSQDIVELPPEYIEAITSNLILKCAPLFGVPVDQNMVISASSASKHIKQENAVATSVNYVSDLAKMFNRGRY